MLHNGDRVLWEGQPSQLIHLPKYILCGLASLLILVLGYGGSHYLQGLEQSNFPAFKGLYWVLWSTLFIIPLLVAGLQWLYTQAHTYQITEEQFIEAMGLFNRDIDTLELYRVKDVRCRQPLLLRLFGYGNLVLYTSDASTPVITLTGIRRPLEVHRLIRRQVEMLRFRKGVREIDTI